MKFSKQSQKKLNTCHPFLQEICNELIKEIDFTVICGHRDKEAQNEAYVKGASKLKWPKSKHNTKPSKAVDLAPYPINWNDHERFRVLAQRFKQIAEHKNISITWGGDFVDFEDMLHFELNL